MRNAGSFALTRERLCLPLLCRCREAGTGQCLGPTGEGHSKVLFRQAVGGTFALPQFPIAMKVAGTYNRILEDFGID